MKRLLLLLVLVAGFLAATTGLTGVFTTPVLAATIPPSTKCYEVVYDEATTRSVTNNVPCNETFSQGFDYFQITPEANGCYIASWSLAALVPIACAEADQKVTESNGQLREAQEERAQEQSANDLQSKLDNPERVTCTDTQSCVNDNPLVKLLIFAVNILSGAVAIIVVIVIIIAGIQYSAAGGNPNATAEAKKRITNAIIALIAYLLLFMAFQWLIPGGFL